MIGIVKRAAMSSRLLSVGSVLVLLVLCPSFTQAQSFPLPKGVGLSVKAISYGAEIYVPISVGDRWEIGLQYVHFWKGGYFHNWVERQNTGIKFRYYPRPSKSGHYFSTTLSANGYQDLSAGNSTTYTPVLGASYGYEVPLVGNWMKLGFELEGGFGTVGKGYLGAGISLGLYNN